MEPRPNPVSPPSRPTPILRLVAGIAVAALGAVLLGAGLLSITKPAATSMPAAIPPALSPTASAGTAVASITPSPTTPSPTTTPPTTTPPTTTPPTTPPATADVTAAPPADPVIVGAGDIARCDSDMDEATASLIDGMPGTVFTLGDTAYDKGSEAELRDCYGPTWGRFRDRTRFVVTGNHDIRTDDGAPLRAYFGDAAARDGVTWFSEDVGTWHVIVLDSNCGALDGGCGPESAQVRWLRDDLAASSARCTLALWHHPRFSSGEHGNDTAVTPFWDALQAAGADLVLNGHDHDYERFAPQDPDGRPNGEGGITELVVGTGGAGLRDFATSAANAIVRSSVAHGVLELTLQPDGWRFRFVSTDGSFSDQGSGTCR